MKTYRKDRTQYAKNYQFKYGIKLLFLIGGFLNVEYFEDMKGNIFKVIGR